MKRLTAIAVVTTAEGERVSYTYTELDADARITAHRLWRLMKAFWLQSAPSKIR